MKRSHDIQKSLTADISALIITAREEGIIDFIDNCEIRIYLVKGIFILADHSNRSIYEGLQIGKYFQTKENLQDYHCVEFFIPIPGVHTVKMFNLKELEVQIKNYVKKYIKFLINAL